MSSVRPAPERLLSDTVVSLSMFLVTASIAAFVLAGRLPLTAYLFAHVGASALAVLIAIRSGDTPRRQALLHALMATAMGPVGSAGSFLCCILEAAFRPHARPFSEWFDSIFPDDIGDERDAFLELVRTSNDPLSNSMRITSFRDTMAAGSIEQKQALLGLIARRFSPPFSPALHQALRDRVPAIRVQAAAAVASIENRYAERTFELNHRLNHAAAKPDDIKALAQHLVEFSESGIAEPLRSEEARKAALGHYNTFLAMVPTDAAALIASSRLLLHYGEAREVLERTKRAAALSGETAEIATLQMQALFQLNRFDDIRKKSRHWLDLSKGKDRDNRRMQTALRLWTAENAHAG